MDWYVRWLRGVALPFWAERGAHPVSGRFHERLSLAGNPIGVPHRAMVQARQIAVFARAAAMGWFPEGAELACRAMAALRQDYGVERDSIASFAFSADEDGRIVSPIRDAYTHAFVLFAIAWLFLATGNSGLRALAAKTAMFVQHSMSDPVNGGLYETDRAGDRSKRQNPVMHLLEAYLALALAFPEDGYAGCAEGLVDLLHSRILRHDAAIILEHHQADWTDHPDPAKAGIVEPGHLFEWSWLLLEYARLAEKSPADTAQRLFLTALRYGVTPRSLIVDSLSSRLHVTGPAHRLWPHTEAIKAAAALASQGYPPAFGVAEQMAATLREHFLARPFAAGWVDRLDEQARHASDHIPASSLYHLFWAGAEASASRAGRHTI